jgi:DNA-binding SARP family transcriptional activator
MRFNILGALEVTHDGEVITPSAPKVCWALALLLVRANHIVSTDTLIAELWGEDPPRSAVTTAQTYIYQLRKTFRRILGEAGAEELLATRAPGYVLRVGPGELDAAVFEQRVEQGRARFEAGDFAAASELLRGALALWRGSALVDVSAGRVLEAYVAHLEEARIRALELRIQADIQLGRHRELIPDLRSLVSLHPLNEWIHGHLISALNLAGRRGEALQAYQRLREVLASELGLEPSAPLQRLQRDVLSSAPHRWPVRPAAGLALA